MIGSTGRVVESWPLWAGCTGALAYCQVVRKLFANGEATTQDAGESASGVGICGVVETQESVG